MQRRLSLSALQTANRAQYLAPNKQGKKVKEPIHVLDHGYVRFIEDYGRGDAGVAEAGIIEAARQSTQGSFRGWDTDEKLLSYLYENRHDTPFEFAGMIIEVRAPIFVFREWHRHRTQSYNEMSARYGPLPDLNYLPTPDRIVVGDKQNKQAGAIKGADEPTHEDALEWLAEVEAHYEIGERLYRRGLNMGFPKECARIVNPVGRYSQMRANAVLRNWLAFMTLRCDPNAQWEIRQFAWTVADIIEEQFPRTSKLWRSRQELIS
jgi:thymidylate synthase (FAD)